MSVASALRSEGARLERKAMRAKLRRRLEVLDRRRCASSTSVRNEVRRLLRFVLTRQQRYDAKAGGL